MGNQASEFCTDKFNGLEAKFRDAAENLHRPALAINILWRSFAVLAQNLTSKGAAEGPSKNVKTSLIEFAKQAIENNLNFKEVFQFLKRIRKIFMEHFEEIEPPAVRSSISFLFDDFEYCLFQEWLRLETLPYHKKLREANRFILHEKRRYYTIFNRMSEPAFIIDHELRLIETNRAFDKFFMLTGKSHLGRICFDVIGQEIRGQGKIEKVLDAQASFPGIETVLRIKEEEKNVIMSGTFLGDLNREFSGGIIIIQDITPQKTYEKALKESEEKYRTLVENVPDVTWRADQYGTLCFVSQNVEMICGYKPEELLGAWPKGRFAKIHPDDLDYVRNEFGLFFESHLPSGYFLRNLLSQSPEALIDERIINGRKKYDVRYRFQKKDGSWIWLHGRASNIYEQDGQWFTDGVFSDITELKKAEEELERHHFRLSELIDERTAELREANENLELEINIRKQAEQGLLQLAAKLRQSNEELEQFAHVASHDLKEPLMLITAFSKKLINKYSGTLDERGREYLQRIIKSTQQMQQLIEGLLELSRVASREKPFELLNLTEVVNEAVQNLEERIKKNSGQIKFGELGELTGDKTQIRQLFQNIIANAIKYRHEHKAPLVTVKSSIVDDNFYEIIIQDNGIGFDPRYAEKIFQPLTRLHAHREYEGTGIGLATCQKIVIRHGGKIVAISEPGKGSTFIVRLPITPHKGDSKS